MGGGRNKSGGGGDWKILEKLIIRGGGSLGTREYTYLSPLLKFPIHSEQLFMWGLIDVLNNLIPRASCLFDARLILIPKYNPHSYLGKYSYVSNISREVDSQVKFNKWGRFTSLSANGMSSFFFSPKFSITG